MIEKKTGAPVLLPEAQEENTQEQFFEFEDSAELMIDPEGLGKLITELMRPVVQSFGKMIENNTVALERLSATQAIQNDRLEAMEKQIRLQTPVTSKQVTYLNDSVRQRARLLLDKKGIDDKKAITKLGGAIRKSVLARYGIGNMREIPKHEYSIAMSQIEMWNDMLIVRDVVKEVREREETNHDNSRISTAGNADKS